MYICICKAVTDRQLQQAIDGGLCSRKQLFECFGVGGDCGKCGKDVRAMLARQLQQPANQPELQTT